MKKLNTIREITEAILAGKEVEFRRTDGCEWMPLKSLFVPVDRIDDKAASIYRIKPTKPSIDWSHVHPRYNYLARDKNGKLSLYVEEPYKVYKTSWYNEGHFTSAMSFSSLDAGTCDWTESLVERPEN